MNVLEKVKDKIAPGQPLDRSEALRLLTEADLLELGMLANGIRQRLHPEDIVTFVVDRNVNYTNICESKCKFCAFYRSEGTHDAYLLGYEDIFCKVEELVSVGGTQLLMQGGLH